ncbi:LOW QUALITY PROTEIN: uncharacterized protein ACR2FA_000177 [Aphomia sociella]
MTRFARSRGSKASNEKTPEDSTPWEVMKEQLQLAKKEKDEQKIRQEAENRRIENYENFLKEQKTQKRKAVWCDFPETEGNQVLNTGMKNKKKKNGNKIKEISEKSSTSDVMNSSNINDTNISIEIKKKKNKNKNSLNPHDSNEANVNKQLQEVKVENETLESNDPSVSKEKKNKRHENENLLNTQDSNDVNVNKQLHEVKVEKDTSESNYTSASKNKKKNKKNKNGNSLNPQDSNDVNVNKQWHEVKGENETSESNNTSISKKNKKKSLQTNTNPSASQIIENEPLPTDENKNSYTVTKQFNNKKNKEKKLINGKPVRRKEINDNSFQLIINGKEVELVRFDGFPVMKKDAERLHELKVNMLHKGIPKSEIQRTMKLERRRAEKALARVKRDVCYNCRKGGHNLSDCPDLKSKIPGVDAAEGVCFKCGSTEHRQFECKVQRDKEFRFATCFICKEPGHIARQCPDNPKGLYPNGGSCKLCGDVTHLRKDCPTVDKKEEKSIKLHTLDSTNDLEGIGQQVVSTNSQETFKKVKKIKF